MAEQPWIATSLAEDGCWRLDERRDALTSLSLSDTQSPDFICLIGGPYKSKLLRELITSPPACPPNPHNNVHLWTESRSHRVDTPRVFVDCELHREAPPAQQPVAELAPQRSRTIAWAKRCGHADVAHAFYGRVLAPLSSVVCFFASDLGGLRGVARLIADQLVSGRPNRVQPEALPRALVVVDTSSYVFDAAVAEARLFEEIGAALQDTSDRDPRDLWPDLLTYFHDVRVLGLQKEASPELRARILRRRVAAVSASAHSARRLSRTLFATRHSYALFSLLIDNFCNGQDPFDFIKSSRAVGFSLQDFPVHLKDLLDSMPSEAWLWHTVAPLVASTLFLASYPPESHYFEPTTVFSRLYQGICETTMIEYTIHREVREKFITSVKDEFVSMFRALVSDEGSTAAHLHGDTLKILHTSLQELKSHRSCFCCLMRTPEKVLGCGHALCDGCIQIFGTATSSNKYTFELPSCPLCGAADEEASFNFIPPTAGIRILSLDGGGVRGVVELAILRQLHNEFSRFSLPLPDYFDYVCGTSAGGLIILGLFLMQWTPEQCLDKFERLAAQTFGNSTTRNSFSRLRQTFLSYMNDGKYESDIIEAAFQNLTKRPVQMFNPLKSETKVAVTTTTARDIITCLFANYNGRRRPSGVGYQIVRAQNPQDDVLIHEAASSTSAAPWFFKPKVLKNLGTFQDGGLQHNNPLGIALCEYRFIWPDRGDPDFALSIGTGTSFNSAHAVFEPRSPVQDRTLRRLFRSFMRNTDGEKAWSDFINAVPESSRHRYHRLNISLEGSEPEIDDVSSMKRLRHMAEQYIQSSANLNSVRDTMFASMFYFELDDIPIMDGNTFKCTGVIFCRMNLSYEARKAFYEHLFASSFYFLLEGRPVRCVEKIPKGYPLYRKRVEFRASNMDYNVSITLGGMDTSHYISGLPKKLEDLVSCQKLDAPFGRINHLSFGRQLPPLPLKRKRARLASGEFF